MKIAIDLNDVLRDYSNNFVRYYCEYYNHEYNLDEFSLWTNDLSAVLPFKSQRAYERFVYEDFAFELFGKCDACNRKLPTELNKWIGETIPDIETEEPIEVMIVSTMEDGLTIGQSYFFLSKISCKIREVYFPKDSRTIWDKCDVLITANPDLIKNKPENKKVIKIKTEYNTEIPADYEFITLGAFLRDKNNTEKLLEKDV